MMAREQSVERRHLQRSRNGVPRRSRESSTQALWKTIMKRISRRQFVRRAAAGVALPYIVPARVLGSEAPSKKITIGFIGTGDHGTAYNLHRYLQLKEAKVVMVCDVDGFRMRRAKAM